MAALKGMVEQGLLEKLPCGGDPAPAVGERAAPVEDSVAATEVDQVHPPPTGHQVHVPPSRGVLLGRKKGQWRAHRLR